MHPPAKKDRCMQPIKWCIHTYIHTYCMQHILYAMAQDEAAGSSEASVASSSPAACWWDTITTPNSSSILMPSSSSAACSWNAPAMINNHGLRWKLPPDQLAASNSCNIDDDDEVPADISISANSFANPSTPAGSGDHSESHLWNQLLLGSEVGNSEGMQQISSHQKNIMRSTLMFDEPAACDYLKKLEGGNWDQLTSNMNSSADDISSCSSLLEKQLIRGGYNDTAGGELGHHNSESSLLITCSSLTDLVSKWSIAPPINIYNHHHHQKHHQTRRIGDHHLSSPDQYIKHEQAFHSYADHDHAQQQLDHHALHQNQLLIGPVIGLKNRGLMADAPCSSTTSTSTWSNIINSIVPRNNLSMVDLISFTPSLLTMNKQQHQQQRPSASMELRAAAAAAGGHHHQPASSSSYSYRKGGGGRDPSGSTAPSPRQGKKKTTATHDHCTSPFKKPKHHQTSTTTTTTASLQIIKSLQAPKVKVGDKITALQQLVSPFGKTDTASVLLEAIKYIRILQEQVQLLSDPYLKPNANKDQMISSWPASMERKEKAEPKHDLRGRGLCLVPISCTPQAYRENSGPDFWTPPFRGCLYR